MTRTLTAGQIRYMRDHPDETRIQLFLGSAIACLVVSVLSTALRFWARRRMGQPLLRDDWVMVFATILMIGLCGERIAAVKQGYLGRHILYIDFRNIPAMTRYIVSFSVIVVFNYGVVRAATLLLYIRIFAIRRFIITAWAVLILQLIPVTICSILIGTQCLPIAKSWRPSIPGHCLNIQKLALAATVVSVISDFIVFLLPIPWLIKLLHVSRTRKAALCFLFLMGSCVCGIAVYRLTLLSDVDSVDISYTSPRTGSLTIIELAGGILCTNLIIIAGPIGRKIRSHFGSLSFSKNSRQSTSNKPIMKDQRLEKAQDASTKQSTDLLSTDNEQNKSFTRSGIRFNTVASEEADIHSAGNTRIYNTRDTIV